MRGVDIHKAGGVLIRDRKALVTRSKGKDLFVNPGGKLEPGESVTQALIRELREELRIETGESDLEKLGTFYAQAAYDESKYLQMDVFWVKEWRGEITPSNEIEEIAWIDSRIPDGMQIGSIFLHDIIPHLVQRDLID